LSPRTKQDILNLRKKFSRVEDPPSLDQEDISAIGRTIKAIKQ